MPTTVDIIIKGIAICYRKGANWHVLFPIDADGCHKINFSYKKGDNSDLPIGALAKSTGINIKIEGGSASSNVGETPNFTNHVLDLTSTRTHPRIRKKGDLTGKAVLLTIPNARFSINKYLEEFPGGKIPALEELPAGTKQPLTTLAHSVKATITLDDGAHAVVESNVLKDGRFPTDAGFSCILTFNNDCETPKPEKNDMDMFYEVIEEFDGTSVRNRKFRIGGVGAKRTPIDKVIERIIEELRELGFDEETIDRLLASGFDMKVIGKLLVLGIDKETLGQLIKLIILSEPPNFAGGKPCLVVKVSEQESIKTLPPES